MSRFSNEVLTFNGTSFLAIFFGAFFFAMLQSYNLVSIFDLCQYRNIPYLYWCKYNFCMSEETTTPQLENEPVALPVNGNGDTNAAAVLEKTLGFLSATPKRPLPDNITQNLIEIEQELGMPLWVIIQNNDSKQSYSSINHQIYKHLYNQRGHLEKDKPIALLLESGGGSAESAYAIAKLINNISGKFYVIIPQYAKSAATLLSLGAVEIRMGKEAHLGPLDVQIKDPDKDDEYSALDEIQSLDSLFEYATRQVLLSTNYWSELMDKKRGLIFPDSIQFVVGMMKPLMEKIDTVHYTTLSRLLRVSEEYAIRLLDTYYENNFAKQIARKFVRNYPNHGFNIDSKEAEKIGLQNIKLIDENMQKKADEVIAYHEKEGIQLFGKFFTTKVPA